ncbi:MAG: hypothetical protein VZQ55_00160 [Ruminococcus sp.]|nr:hypothetical protein [Ruminococcus sp.]
MTKLITTKRTIGMLAVLLAFIIELNVITPSLSETIRQSFLSNAGSVNSASGYSLDDIEVPVKTVDEDTSAVQNAYEDGTILIYNYTQLSMIGSGKS